MKLDWETITLKGMNNEETIRQLYKKYSVTKVAEALGVNRNVLLVRMHDLGIEMRPARRFGKTKPYIAILNEIEKRAFELGKPPKECKRADFNFKQISKIVGCKDSLIYHYWKLNKLPFKYDENDHAPMGRPYKTYLNEEAKYGTL